MGQSSLEAVLTRLGRTMRLRRAAARALWPSAALLCAAAAAVLIIKLVPAAGSGTAGILLAVGAVAAAALVFGLAYLTRPVTELAAAMELDLLAGLKERAASLVAVRRSGRVPGPLNSALESDLGRALGTVDERHVFGRAAELPRGTRWLGVLLAALAAALLVPGRRTADAETLAELMVNGGIFVPELRAAAGNSEGTEQGPTGSAARRALILIKATPPGDPGEAEARASELRELAEQLRRSGREDLAGGLEEAVAALKAAAAAGETPGATPSRPGGTGPADAERYPAQYRELLAKYFAENDWNGRRGGDSIAGP